MKKDDGGSVYPIDIPTGEVDLVAGRNRHVYKLGGGMAVRDVFAGRALAGLLSSPTGLGSIEAANKASRLDITAATARIAYGYAQAMIDEMRRLEK